MCNPVNVRQKIVSVSYWFNAEKNVPIKSTYRVVLADDHAMFRQDLKRILM
jgi:hypothetical protein